MPYSSITSLGVVVRLDHLRPASLQIVLAHVGLLVEELLEGQVIAVPKVLCHQ
jgi:hypothetical protein